MTTSMLIAHQLIGSFGNPARGRPGVIFPSIGAPPRWTFPVDLSRFPAGIEEGKTYRISWSSDLLDSEGNEIVWFLDGSTTVSSPNFVTPGPQSWEFEADVNSTSLSVQGSSDRVAALSGFFLEEVVPE